MPMVVPPYTYYDAQNHRDLKTVPSCGQILGQKLHSFTFFPGGFSVAGDACERVRFCLLLPVPAATTATAFDTSIPPEFPDMSYKKAQ